MNHKYPFRIGITGHRGGFNVTQIQTEIQLILAEIATLTNTKCESAGIQCGYFFQV